MKPLRLLPLVAVVTCLGCARTSPPPAELREYERLEANERDANKLLDAGTTYADQDVHEFLRLCKPYRADFVDRYTFVEFYGRNGRAQADCRSPSSCPRSPPTAKAYVSV